MKVRDGVGCPGGGGTEVESHLLRVPPRAALQARGPRRSSEVVEVVVVVVVVLVIVIVR